MDYKKLKDSCDRLHDQYNELRYHYDKLKKDNKELIGVEFDEFDPNLTVDDMDLLKLKIIKKIFIKILF